MLAIEKLAHNSCEKASDNWENRIHVPQKQSSDSVLEILFVKMSGASVATPSSTHIRRGLRSFKGEGGSRPRNLCSKTSAVLGGWGGASVLHALRLSSKPLRGANQWSTIVLAGRPLREPDDIQMTPSLCRSMCKFSAA